MNSGTRKCDDDECVVNLSGLRDLDNNSRGVSRSRSRSHRPTLANRTNRTNRTNPDSTVDLRSDILALVPETSRNPLAAIQNAPKGAPKWLERVELERIDDRSNGANGTNTTARPRGLHGDSYTSKKNSFSLKMPEYAGSISDADFYKDTFDNDKSANNSLPLYAIARAVRAGYAVTSDKDCVLTTTAAREEVLTPVQEDMMRRYWVTRLGEYADSGHNPFTIEHWRWVLDKYPADSIGSGSFNEVSLLKTLKCNVTNEKSGTRTCSVVLRENKDTATESDVVKEIYFTGYASYCGIGPQLLASYYSLDTSLNKNTDILFASDELVKDVVSLSAAWDGDVDGLIQLYQDKDGFSETFGKLFVELVVKAVNCGIFHADIKPKNLLYCWTDSKKGDFSSLKLCMTDFDPGFITLMTPNDRLTMQGCAVVATVAMFLGMVRCHYDKGNNKGLWNKIRDGIKKPLDDALSRIGNEPYPRKGSILCDFLTYEATIHDGTLAAVTTSMVKLVPEYEECEAIYNASLANLKVVKSAFDAAGAAVDQGKRDLGSNRGLRGLQSAYQGTLDRSRASLKASREANEKARLLLNKVTKEINVLQEERIRVTKDMSDDTENRKILKDQMEKEADYKPYTGQMLHATKDWQTHVGHYITNRAWYRTQPGPNSGGCLQLKSDLSLYDQVMAYAFVEQYKLEPMNKKKDRKYMA